jgi:hypothetical protein
MYVSASQRFFPGGAPKINSFTPPGTTAYQNLYRPENKEAVGSTRILLQHSPLLEKIPVVLLKLFGIFRGIETFLGIYFTVSHVTLLGKHCRILGRNEAADKARVARLESCSSFCCIYSGFNEQVGRSLDPSSQKLRNLCKN